MKTEFGYVTQSFRPKIESHLCANDLEFFDFWRINNIAIPAPTIDPTMEAAVWVGRHASPHGESPIIANIVYRGEVRHYNELKWHVGVANFGWEEGEFGKTSSELELAKLAIDNAEHGPNSFSGAKILIKSFMNSQMGIGQVSL
jgi:hypothetical protein